MFPSCGRSMLIAKVIQATVFNTTHRNRRMDDYQEELLEYQAFELDPLEPAEDATEL